MTNKTNEVTKKQITVFLGGTCNESTWREELIPMLCNAVDAFNPVVDDWNETAQANEDWHKANDDFCLYVLTPEMSGLYSIFEIADSSNKYPKRTICCFLRSRNGKEFNDQYWRGIKKMKQDLMHNGATVCENLAEVANFLNQATQDETERN